MKKGRPQSLFIIGCCLIYCNSFGQVETGKIYAIRFPDQKTKLSKRASATVDSIAATMRAQPDFNFAISCCMVCGNSRKNTVMWDRVNNIVTKLVTKYGIKPERLLFGYDDYPENCNEVRFRYTEERISTDAPPHPSLRNRNSTLPCRILPLPTID